MLLSENKELEQENTDLKNSLKGLTEYANTTKLDTADILASGEDEESDEDDAHRPAQPPNRTIVQLGANRARPVE